MAWKQVHTKHCALPPDAQREARYALEDEEWCEAKDTESMHQSVTRSWTMARDCQGMREQDEAHWNIGLGLASYNTFGLAAAAPLPTLEEGHGRGLVART